MVFRTGRADIIALGPETGVLGFVAAIPAIVSWFTILLRHEHFPASAKHALLPAPRVRARSHLMLLEDQHRRSAMPVSRDADGRRPGRTARSALGRTRILLAIPHFIVLACLLTAWWLTIVAWFVIPVTPAIRGDLQLRRLLPSSG